MLKFFIDFDGTITTEDVIDKILERFADPSWRLIEEEWAGGKIGSRECLIRQMELVSAPPGSFRSLVDAITIDPHFADFLRCAAARRIPVAIVSDGLTEVIQRVLQRALGAEPALLEGLPVFANRVRWDATGPRLVFDREPCAHGCANCKEAVMRANLTDGERVLFVGDGLSDRYAAAAADLVFAKNALLDYCREKGLSHMAYKDFSDIEKWLEKVGPGPQ